MQIDFEKPITIYEAIALCISIFWPIILSVGKWFYNKYIKKLKFTFIPTGMITLYFDKNGSYFVMGGVYEAKCKSTTVRNITAFVERESDKAMLNLRWSTFSPAKVRVSAGNIERESEIAHPFKVESDTLFPVSIEFENANEHIIDKFSNLLKPVHDTITFMMTQQHLLPEQVNTQIRQMPDMDRIKQLLNDNFFWRSGTYCVNLITKYNDSVLYKKCKFTLSEEESGQIRNNIDNLLMEPMATYYNRWPFFATVSKEFTEIL